MRLTECYQVIGGPYGLFGLGSDGDNLTDQSAFRQFIGHETENEGGKHLDQSVL